jgi:hypothetical protein
MSGGKIETGKRGVNEFSNFFATATEASQSRGVSHMGLPAFG